MQKIRHQCDYLGTEGSYDLVRHHTLERAHAIQRLKAFSARPDILSSISLVVIEALRDADHDECQHALKTLTAFGSAAVPTLNQALRDTNTVLRGRAAVVLGLLGPVFAKAIRALIEALDDKYEEIRSFRHNNPRTAGPLAVDAALDSIDHSVRMRAVGFLIRVGIKTDGKMKLPSNGWLRWENETYIIIDNVPDLRVYRKRPGKRWDDRWPKDFYSWQFENDRDGMPVCVYRSH